MEAVGGQGSLCPDDGRVDVRGRRFEDGKPKTHDTHRNHVDIMSGRLKDGRRVASRYDRGPKVFLSAAAYDRLASAIWPGGSRRSTPPDQSADDGVFCRDDRSCAEVTEQSLRPSSRPIGQTVPIAAYIPEVKTVFGPLPSSEEQPSPQCGFLKVVFDRSCSISAAKRSASRNEAAVRCRRKQKSATV